MSKFSLFWSAETRKIERQEYPSSLLKKFYGYRDELLVSGKKSIVVGKEGRTKTLKELNRYINSLEESQERSVAKTAADLERVGGDMDKLAELYKERELREDDDWWFEDDWFVEDE